MDLAYRGGKEPQGKRGMFRRGLDGEGERGVPDIVEVDVGDQQGRQSGLVVLRGEHTTCRVSTFSQLSLSQ